MRKILKTMCFVASLTVSAGGARADTLADTMTFAYRDSGLIAQNRAVLRAADEDVAQAVAALRPVVSWLATAGYRYQESSLPNGTVVDQEIAAANLEFTATMTLYDFGRNRLAIEAAKEQVLGTRQNLIAAEQDVLLRAVQTHMGVVRAQNVLELRQSNMRLITRELRAAEDRFELGEITRTDVEFARARLASARTQLAAAQGDLATAAEAYRAVTGRAPHNLRMPSPASVNRNQNAAREFAQRNHPKAIGQRHNVAVAELNIRRAETARLPTVQLQGKVGFDQDLNNTSQLGVSVGGQLYQGGAMSSRLRQAMAQRDAARAGLHQIAAAIGEQVGNAYVQLSVTGQLIDSSARQVRAARSAYNALQDEASLGARTTLDVLSAEQSLLDAQLGAVSAQIDQVIASYYVLAAQGVLTASQLQLPVQQYDFNAYYNAVKNAPLRPQSEQGQALDRILQGVVGN